MSWKEVLATTATIVVVGSYGYTEGRVLSHFEPFSHKREFKFEIVRFSNGDGYLNHKWLILKDDESTLDFEQREDGTIYLDDPDLFSDIS